MRKHRKLACLAKIETVYATDSVPTGAANAIQLNDVTLTPLAGEDVSRDLLLPWLGHQGTELTGNYLQLEFSVEIAGAGAAGTVPGYGALLRACAFSETITALTSVVYEPVSDGEESVSIYFVHDGVRHVALGCRGNCQMDFAPRQIPRFRFTMMGLLGVVSDQALPSVDLASFQKPVPVSKAATSLSLHGASRIAESVSIDLGNEVEPRFLIGDERIQLTDRQSSGSAVVEAKTMAEKNWFDAAQAKTLDTLQVVHGTAAGHIVQVDAPKVQIGRPTQGQNQKIITYTLPLMLIPNTGDDELVITVK